MLNLDTIFDHFLEFHLISTDSRKIPQNCIFFALRGDNFNGNLFALEALEKGAAYAIVDEEVSVKDARIFHVSSVLTSLQQFATRYRSRFDIPVIAITGSNGKTTTKELISNVLSADFKVHYTKGNFNNHIGVPLTLLQLKDEHSIAVIEMGANHQKEIAELCEIAKPTHGLITNIGKAHLEGFGGEEGVKIGKGELFDYLELNQGVVFANHSEASLEELYSNRNIKKVSYSNNSKSAGFMNIDSVDNNESLSLQITFFNEVTISLNTNLQGDYNLSNLVNAICIGVYFRISIPDILAQIEAYHPTNNRSQLKTIDSNIFLLDAYNANPSSMSVAIENFKKVKHSHKIAILGEMYELGEYSITEHKFIANQALNAGFEKVIFVGKLFPEATFLNVDELKEWFRKQNFQEKYFLLKGSRGVALEKLVD